VESSASEANFGGMAVPMAGKLPSAGVGIEDRWLCVPERLLVVGKMPIPRQSLVPGKLFVVGDLLGMKKLPLDLWLLVPGR